MSGTASPLYHHQTREVQVDDASAVREAERTARDLARSLGFGEKRREEVAIATSELASNVSKHTRGGVLYIQATPASLPTLRVTGMQVLAADDGPGTESFQRCLADGYSTTGTLGAGLGAVRRLTTRFAAYSLPARGSVVLADFAPEAFAPEAFAPGTFASGTEAAGAGETDLGALCLPAPGERVSGDAYGLAAGARGWNLLMVDGLGHGEAAAEASHAAIRLLPELGRRSLADSLLLMHERLRGTRGAAAAALRVDAACDQVEFCGIGNISGAILDYGPHGRRLVSQPGTVGRRLSRPVTQRFRLPPDPTLLLHTDGISNRWNLDYYPWLLGQPPAVTAAAFMHDHRRRTDDSTVAVLRPRPKRPGAGPSVAPGAARERTTTP